MFGSMKEEAEVVAEQNQTATPIQQNSGEVYIMPEKYMLIGSIGSSSKKLIVAGIVLIFVIIITASFLAYDIIQSQRQRQAALPSPVPPSVEIIEDIPPALPIETIVEEPEEEPDDENDTDETEEEEPIEEDEEEKLAVSLDTDGDGLTDVEEIIFGTSPTNPDTDGDSYRDGAEVIAGFNPTVGGGSKLGDSPFIISLTANFNDNDYSVLYPKEWQSSLINASSQILITASTGEIFRITIRENQMKLPMMSWYLQENPGVPVSQLRLTDNLQGSLSGIYSPDGLMAYLTDANREKMYVFEYVVGRQAEIKYPTIFSMIIRTFKVLEASVNNNTTNNTTNNNALSNNQNNNSINIIKNSAEQVLRSSCSDELSFCQLSSCGALADADSSCEDNDIGYCYQSQCTADTDCSTGKSCKNFDCFVGEAQMEVKLCD
jgi:hypothetical protein